MCEVELCFFCGFSSYLFAPCPSPADGPSSNTTATQLTGKVRMDALKDLSDDFSFYDF